MSEINQGHVFNMERLIELENELLTEKYLEEADALWNQLGEKYRQENPQVEIPFPTLDDEN